MNHKRVSLYEKLPEIYRVRDAEGQPPYQLRQYLALVEEVFGAIHENIEALYHDLFIETCEDWVIPYIGDLLGTSHLKGDPWTLRADVADTIALRRRKGTLSAIALLTHDLTGWGVHGVELRDNLVWNQHLNHQRPDAGGLPPYGQPEVNRYTVIRGGTAALRDPAMLSLLNTPFDPYAHVADVKPPAFGSIRYNLPNLAIFLWRLATYTVPVSKPAPGVLIDSSAIETVAEAPFVVRFHVDPLGRPLRLFNTNRLTPEARPPQVSRIDETPGMIPAARLTEGSEAGNPEAYLSVETYDPTAPVLDNVDITDMGLQLHLPASEFPDESWPLPEGPQIWSVRGGNLCAWETVLQPPIRSREIVIDPVIGRIAIGVEDDGKGSALIDHLLLTYTYGAVGPVGAHPISRSSSPLEWNDERVDTWSVDFYQNPNGLREALLDVPDAEGPVVIEIHDSMTHEVDLSALPVEDGGPNLRLRHSLFIRAADGHRPVIKLAQPLRFRPADVYHEHLDHLIVRLEGVYLTRGEAFSSGEPLIARAALNSLEILDCTLDPGGDRVLDGTAEGTRAPIRTAMVLKEPYGFADPDEEDAFDQTPEIMIRRSVAGPLFIDTGYRLFLTDSILDAGGGVNDDPSTAPFALSGAGDPAADSWGPWTRVEGLTVFGRMRVESLRGKGGVWVHTLEVLRHQEGCIKFSYFSGHNDRLPQHHACVEGTEAQLRFTSEIFGEPAYGQLAHDSDFCIRERGPDDDAMGAFGFLLEAHRWRNLQIRYREFMPLGIRPLLIPVT